MKRKNKIMILLVFLVIAYMFTIWTIDLSIGAMLIEKQHNINMFIGNGFLEMKPMVTYHIALYSNIIILFLIASLFIIKNDT